jgi:hypothetical protein
MNVERRMSQWFRFFAWLSVLGLAVASWTPGEEMIRTGVRGSFEHIAAYFISTLMLMCAYPGWSSWTIGGALAVYAGAGLLQQNTRIAHRHTIRRRSQEGRAAIALQV